MTLLGWVEVTSVPVGLFAAFRALTRRHRVADTLAWLFGIAAFPWLGALAYLILAGPSIRRTVRRKRLAAEAARAAAGGHGRRPDLAETGSPLRAAAFLTGLPPSAGNAVTLQNERDAAFAAVERALAGATRSIWVEYFIIRNDETGRQFLRLLTQRAAAGVEVRLLYDALGSLGLDAHAIAALKRAGGRAEAFLPVNPLRRRWAVHLRNHRKLIVVDGEQAFTGGMNVGDEYRWKFNPLVRRQFHDLQVGLKGPVVGELAQVFAEDWRFATGHQLARPPVPAPAPGGTAVAAAVPSGPDQPRNAMAHAFFAAITGARRSCWLMTPYFLPDDATARALENAALRGVDVRLLVPETSDHPVVAAASRTFYPGLLEAGVRVYGYRPAMLHAKALVVDGTLALVGSANVNIRSFRLNFELGVLVRDPAFAVDLERRFLDDQAASRPFHVPPRRLTAARFGEDLARLFSPLL